MTLDIEDLVDAWSNSPEPSIKTTSYFPIYVNLFRHLRNKKCTFIETGVLEGGSLFMWKKWLGPEARIIGIDLNPEAKKWESSGFEIFIGDQACPNFWNSTFSEIGRFDAFLDDGGHQSFQQMVSLQQAIHHSEGDCVIAVEDTYTSFMNDFQSHKDRSFLEYSKDATDLLVGRSFSMYPGRFPENINSSEILRFQKVFNISFFNGIVAFHIAPDLCLNAAIVRNKQSSPIKDFRYEGLNQAAISWPNILRKEQVIVEGPK
jgi:hypothetical protein